MPTLALLGLSCLLTVSAVIITLKARAKRGRKRKRSVDIKVGSLADNFLEEKMYYDDSHDDIESSNLLLSRPSSLSTTDAKVSTIVGWERETQSLMIDYLVEALLEAEPDKKQLIYKIIEFRMNNCE